MANEENKKSATEKEEKCLVCGSELWAELDEDGNKILICGSYL